MNSTSSGCRECHTRHRAATEVVLMVVFTLTALLRTAQTKANLVESGALAKSELSAQDKRLPALLSAIMLCVSIGLPVSL